MLIHATPLIPFHRLATLTPHRGWRTLGGSAFLAAVFGALAVGSGRVDVNPVNALVLELGAVALLLPLVLLTAWWGWGRRPGMLSSVRGHLRWGWLLRCALVAVPVGAASALTGGVAPVWAGWATFVPMLMVTVALVPVQAAAVEYLCRGWLLQSVGALLRSPWVAIGVQASVFALLHGIGTPRELASLAVVGAVAGWLAVRTGGLEAGLALGVVNSLVVHGLAAGTAGGSAGVVAADLAWRQAALAVAYGLVVRWLATRYRVSTVARGPASLKPLAEVSRRRVPTALGPVLRSRSRRVAVSSSSGR